MGIFMNNERDIGNVGLSSSSLSLHYYCYEIFQKYTAFLSLLQLLNK